MKSFSPDRRATWLLLAVALTPSIAAAAAASQPNVLTEQQVSEGWISLFDGQTLFGWRPTSDADWHVAAGEVAVAAGQPGFLMTEVDLADYELHIEFRPGERTNSGVFLRTPLAPADPQRDCIELNIAPSDNPFPTGSLVSRKRYDAGALALNQSTPPPLYGTRDGDPNSKSGSQRGVDVNRGWRSFDVRAIGSQVTVWLDGEELYQIDDAGPRRGRIGLQFREGPVAFRNIRLRPLGLEPLMSGKDLAGWSDAGAGDAKFAVVPSGSLPLVGRAGEGGAASSNADPPSLTLPAEVRGPEGSKVSSTELHVSNGPGYLETDGQYGDFVMQLECFVDGDGLNSGIFFRSIPGEKWNGYECQINNAVIDGDPTKPKDAGTGAIYRRVNARRVVSRDRAWFAATLMATGPHIAVWIDGQQVTSWTDARPPHANPRQGLRLDPGTIQIQAHDPTTNLRFRRMQVSELPKAD